MSKPLVYVSSEIPENGINILKDECRVIVNTERRILNKEEFINRAKEAEGLLVLLSDKIDKEVMERCQNLKVVSNYAVGYNNIDIEEATERGIAVTNTPGVLTETTADQTFGLLIAAARRIVESDYFTRTGKFRGWFPKLLLGTDIHGKTLGIIGLGRIGKAVARRAQGFSMEVIYHNRSRIDRNEEEKLNVEYVDFNELLQISDFITINAPLNQSTYHLLGAKEFKKMKDSAIIVNTGRGPIIKEDDLVKALKNGEIAGAGLDVYEREPLVEPGLMELDNVVLTPHTGSATIEARRKMSEIAAQNAVAVLKGREIPHVVNPEALNKGN